MNEPSRPISDAELDVLKALWLAPKGATVRTVLDQLHTTGHEWAYTTVQTLLQRLEEKGYVRKDASERAHVFRPTLTRDSLVGAQLDDLMDRLCEGEASPLLLSLVQRRSFTTEEIRAFRALLEQLEQNDNPREPNRASPPDTGSGASQSPRRSRSGNRASDSS